MSDMPCGGDAFRIIRGWPDYGPYRDCAFCSEWHAPMEGVAHGKCLGFNGYEHATAAGITLVSDPPR